MKQPLIRCGTFMLAAMLVATTAWAEESPIGTLKAQGSITIEAPNSSFTLEDQEYAYFSGDGILTGEGARAVVGLNEGLNVTFVGSTQGNVAQKNGVYHIELQQGHILVDAEPGVDYQIMSNGAPVAPDQSHQAGEGPFLVSVAESGAVRFYMPAQLDGPGVAALLESAGLAAAEIAAVIGAAASGVVILNDDKGPASGPPSL